MGPGVVILIAPNEVERGCNGVDNGKHRQGCTLGEGVEMEGRCQ
jgi:hypothetical protein